LRAAAAGNSVEDGAKGAAFTSQAADTLPQSETNIWTTSGHRLMRVATVFVWLRDILNRGGTMAAAKIIRVMTKVNSAGTDEGGGCKQAHPKVTAALAGSMKRQRI
jgi:hypothetical protein